MKKLLANEMMVLVLTLVAFLAMGSLAQAKTPTAAEVLNQVDQTMGAESKIMSQKMTLIAPGGQQRTRELRTWSKQSATENQMLARFLSPADVKGTGILMSSDDMWLYLPALGKVRRVASHAKKGSFMGSDLSFDDMEQLGTRGFSRDYEVSMLGEAVLEGSNTYLLQLVPVSQGGDYAYLKMWVDQDVWLPRRIEYFGPNDTPMKVLSTWDLHEVEGRWVATKMIMEDLQKGSQTILEVQDVSFDTEIEDALFTTRNLERGI